MPFKFFSIIKTLAPLAMEAMALASARKTPATSHIEDRIRALEDESTRVGSVLLGVTQQAQAIAEELRAQASWNQAQARTTRTCLYISLAAVVISAAALFAALRP